jgi:cytidine deaminase
MYLKYLMKKNLPCTLNKTIIQRMIEIAKQTRQFSFSHRSKHKIWASVLTADGEIYGGCNIESVISGLWTCAERCAIDNAVAHGGYDIVAVCTVDSSVTPTCGACLQYIMLFAQVSNQDVFIINSDIKWDYKVFFLSDLLPIWYKTKSNLENIRSYSKSYSKKKS